MDVKMHSSQFDSPFALAARIGAEFPGRPSGLHMFNQMDYTRSDASSCHMAALAGGWTSRPPSLTTAYGVEAEVPGSQKVMHSMAQHLGSSGLQGHAQPHRAMGARRHAPPRRARTFTSGASAAHAQMLQYDALAGGAAGAVPNNGRGRQLAAELEALTAYAMADATIRMPSGSKMVPGLLQRHVRLPGQIAAEPAGPVAHSAAYWHQQQQELLQQHQQLCAAVAAANNRQQQQRRHQQQLQLHLQHQHSSLATYRSGSSSTDSSNASLTDFNPLQQKANRPTPHLRPQKVVTFEDHTSIATDAACASLLGRHNSSSSIDSSGTQGSATAAMQALHQYQYQQQQHHHHHPTQPATSQTATTALQAIEAELQELQKLQRWLANAHASAAPGSPAATACDSAMQLHQNVMQQALAAKAALQAAEASIARPSPRAAGTNINSNGMGGSGNRRLQQ